MKKNKSILVMALALGISTSFSSCSNAQNNNQETSTEVNISSTEISKEQAQKILSAYLEIKEALVQTNGENASTAAQKLVTALGESKDELAGKIRFDAEHIAETKDAGHQRDHFNTLSDNVYAMVKATGANADNLYRQYCPMAMDNEGAYWLSSEKEVNNPYFGNKMLHCGSVKETIKGN
jgi:hypothetical protein